MSDNSPIRAVHVPADQFNALFGPENSVRSEARHLIEEAQRVASDLSRAVAQERAALERQIADISKSELEAFLDKERITREAEAFVALMDTAAEVSNQFNTLQPWLETLVQTAITRIVGTLEDGDLVARLVAQGLSEIDPGQHASLRVAPDCLGRAAAAKQTHPQRFAAVQSITADPQLVPGQMFLECASGLVEITLQAQIDAVLSCLEGTAS